MKKIILLIAILAIIIFGKTLYYDLQPGRKNAQNNCASLSSINVTVGKTFYTTDETVTGKITFTNNFQKTITVSFGGKIYDDKSNIIYENKVSTQITEGVNYFQLSNLFESLTIPESANGNYKLEVSSSAAEAKDCVWKNEAIIAIKANAIIGNIIPPVKPKTSDIISTINPTTNKQALFPRLGGYNIGSPQNYNEEEYQKQLAKRDLVILGMYNGWNKGGKTPAQAVKEIKTKNPNILIGNYTIMTEVSDEGESSAVYRNKLNTEKGPNGIGNWWAYNSAGKQTDWSNGAWGGHDVNITSFVTPDASGDRWPEWFAKKSYELLLKDADFNFWFFDNNFWKPHSNADWNRDGTNDDQNNLTVQGWWRTGQRAHYEQAAKTAPNLYRIANIDGDLSGNIFPDEAQPYNEYKNILHGALMEHLIGKNWSVESWGGWKLMMGRYYELFNNLLEPKMVIFEVYGGATDYQTFRYAFASSLMHDGYFAYSVDENYQSYKPLAWFDEYDLAGTSNTKWLGKAIDNPPTKAWQNGVYMRKFENGMAIVNPKGNGSQTITMETGYKRISGKQDSAVNNGQIVNTITLKDRDGIILMKSK